MSNMSGSELLLYGGMILMAVSAAAGAVCTIIFNNAGKKLKDRLKEDYGELERLGSK